MRLSFKIRTLKFQDLYQFTILILFMNSMYPWYIWQGNISLVFIAFGAIISLRKLTRMNYQKRLHQDYGLFIMIVLFTLLMCTHGSIAGSLQWMCQAIIWISLLLLNNEEKIILLNYITKWFSIFLLISLIFYILWLFNIYSLPSTSIAWNEGRYPSDNYLFFISTHLGGTGLAIGFYRFQSIFMEPGHVTMGIVPLIMLNRFNLKNPYVLILFITEVCTFSLAGIITMVVGYFLLNLNKKILKKLFYGLVVVMVIIWAISLTDYSDVLDMYVWRRLAIIGDGKIPGLNRTTDSLNFFFSQFVHSPEVLFGIPGFDFSFDLSEGGSAGYKVYMIQNGIIGLLLIIFIYLYYLFKKLSVTIFAITTVLLLLLFQNAYPTWLCIFGTYLIGMPAIIYKNDLSKPLKIRYNSVRNSITTKFNDY